MLAIGAIASFGMMTNGLFAQAQLVEIENEAEATNEDNDDVKQENKSEIEQKSEIECESEAEVEDNDVIGVTGANTAAAGGNDCDSTQSATVGQANVNTDNDVQVATAEACQQVAALVGFNVC